MPDMFRLLWETLRSILPVVIVLIGVQLAVLRSPIPNPATTMLGVALAFIGLFLFAQGLRMGLLPLGNLVGSSLPRMASAPLILTFGFALGYVATLAEPALLALTLEVDELTSGALPARLLIHTVALGVALGISLGLAKIIWSIPNPYLLIPLLLLTATLTVFAPEQVVGIAYDAAGVTTGPVTVPLTMALAVGLALAIGGRDPLLHGFGLVALASIGPIITVMLLGMLARI